jgi:fibronectin type 3 domain-containing protein
MKHLLTLSSLLLLCLLLLLCQSSGFAQKDTLAFRVIAKATEKKSILLRWAPVSSSAWLYGNRQGYTIERYLLTRNNELVLPPLQNLQEKVQCLPLDAWEKLSESEYFAPIAAQALYGESFELEGSSSEVASFINAAKEQENRYSFALFASDMSWKVAEASGLAWEDKAPINNERYLYKIYPNNPNNADILIDTAFVFIGLQDYQSLPRVTKLQGDFANKTVSLQWNQEVYNRFFSAYIVERSDNGKDFAATSEVPFVSTYSQSEGIAFKIDSLPENDKVYYFRIRGITPFGELSAPSDTVSGKGYIPLSGNPVIEDAYSSDNQSIQIYWNMPSEALAQVKGFSIERAERIEGFYSTVSKELLPPSQKEFIDKDAKISNYYRIKAHGQKATEYAYSLPYYIPLVDSMPPAAPINIAGNIDSLGVVKLYWQANTEEDLLGYRVYRSNAPNDEYSLVSKETLSNTQFSDTININTLTKKIYYKIVAIDRHFNPSAFSEALALTRPDKIAPGAAVFKAVNSKTEGVELQWYKSADDDVAKQVLYRKKNGAREWEVLASLDAHQDAYLDQSAETGILYEYTLVSIDEAGLESPPCRPVSARKLDNKDKISVKGLTGTPQREQKVIVLKWQYENTKELERFIILRAKNNEPLSILSFSKSTEYQDNFHLKVGNSYRYKIKAVFKDGTESKLSEQIVVQW